MNTVTKVIENKEDYDILKTLHVIEHDKDLDKIFRDDKIKLSYPMLCTLASKGTLGDDTAARVKEIYERIILRTKILRNKYRNIITDTLEDPKLPKRYGKKRILEDINTNKETTELDRAMLALNKMKNVYSKLNARAIKDKVLGSKILTRDNCRDIIAVTRMLENKMSLILKKK